MNCQASGGNAKQLLKSLGTRKIFGRFVAIKKKKMIFPSAESFFPIMCLFNVNNFHLKEGFYLTCVPFSGIFVRCKKS